MGFNNNQFKITWQDNNKQERFKVYKDYTVAQKAYKWLISKGVTNLDMAIVKASKPQVAATSLPEAP